ncbi:MAG TPA: HEAT repeat domain-containing protein [Gemmataceae bacterium]|nr:HEAT repeat domain-containing protein [Gemmataceae bacterium]
MSRLQCLSCVAMFVALVLFAPPTLRAEYSEEQYQADLKLFQDAKAPHGDKDLLAFFQARMLAEKDRERIDGLIKQLSSKAFKEREQARAAIEKEGPPALPLLRKVLQNSADLEAKMRAESCIKNIEAKSPNALVAAAARMLKHRRVEGAGAVLLAYVAFAPDDVIEEEVYISIYNLALVGAKLNVLPPAVKSGKLDPAMVAALTDKDATRRAIAALVVARHGEPAQWKLLAKLLTDESPAVRLRAAQGLAMLGDKSCMPVLVELLDKGPLKIAYQAEDLLNVIAQDTGPTVPLGENKDQRLKSHDAWKAWLEKNNGRLDLSKVDADTPFGSLSAQASKAAITFVNALVKFDVAKITKASDVPFTFGGEITFTTRAELDQFLNQFLGQAPPPKDFKFKIVKVISGAQYLKTASERDKGFLQTARIAQVQVVYIEAYEGGQRQPEVLPLYIRISGGKGLCIGFGEPAR